MIPSSSKVWSSRLLWAVVVGSLLWRTEPARASIMIALDLPELVRQAEHIAVVEVASVNAAWDERHERIYSTIELRVVENWKTKVLSSSAPATTAVAPAPAPVSTDRLTIVQPGGTVGDVSMTVFGLGRFVPGERSLVFLRGPTNRAQVVGMTQGKRPLKYEPVSRRWLVTPPDLRQTKLVRTPALPRTTGPSPASPSPVVRQLQSSPLPQPTRDMPLDDLRSEVQRLLGAALP